MNSWEVRAQSSRYLSLANIERSNKNGMGTRKLSVSLSAQKHCVHRVQNFDKAREVAYRQKD